MAPRLKESSYESSARWGAYISHPARHDALQSGAATFPIPRGTTHQQWSSHLGRVCGLREFYTRAAPFRAALEAEGGFASLATRVVYRYLWLQPLPPQMPQMMPQIMQSSWTPTVAMQTATSFGIPQMMQNNEMMPQIMQNLKQSPMMPQMMHAMQNQMEMILRRRSI